MSDRETQGSRDEPGREAEERRPGEGEGEGLVDDRDAPLKRHGDALLDGSGSRHGVLQEEREPGGER